jgi:hypothetical protein
VFGWLTAPESQSENLRVTIPTARGSFPREQAATSNAEASSRLGIEFVV